MKKILTLLLLFTNVALATYFPQTTLLQGNLQLSVTNPLPMRISDGSSFVSPLTDTQLRANPVQISMWENDKNMGVDAFKRWRVSETLPLFDAKNIYDMNPLTMDNILVGGAPAPTYLRNEASVAMTIGSVSGQKITRRSREWIKYHPGSSQLIKITANMGAKVTNVVTRVGYFDDNNGLYFKQDSTGLYVCIRTFTSGAAVDNCTAQANWNQDKLDGLGASGKTVTDFNRNIIFGMDFEWLSYGRVRFFIDFGDKVVVVHSQSFVATASVPYMSTPDLPISYEIENTGTSAGSTMKAVCASVQTEGGAETVGIKYAATNGTTAVAVTTRRPFLSIRPSLLFKTYVNRTSVWPLSSAVMNSGGGNAFCEVIRNGTLTGPSWAQAATDSAVEVDFSATAITGGDLIDTYGVTGTSFTPMDLMSKLPLTLSADGTTQDMLTIVCTNVSGTSSIKAFIDWKEWH